MIINIINIIMTINIIIYSHNHNHIHTMSSVPSTGHPCFSSPLPCSCTKWNASEFVPLRTGDRTHQNGIQRISPQKKKFYCDLSAKLGCNQQTYGGMIKEYNIYIYKPKTEMNWTWNSLSNGQQHAETCKHTRLRDLGSSILGKVPLKPPRMIKNVSEMLVKPTNNRFEERHDFLRNPAFRLCVLNWLPQKNGCSMCSEATKPALLSTLQRSCQGVFQLLQPSHLMGKASGMHGLPLEMTKK